MQLAASRTFPFVSKTLGVNFISLATKAMCGLPAEPYRISLLDIDYVCVKAPMFSFTRLRGADPMLGVRDVIDWRGRPACGEDAHEAFIQALMATGFKLPVKNRTILLSIFNNTFRYEFLEAAKMFITMGYRVYATPGTAKWYDDRDNLGLIPLEKPESEDDDGDGTALQAVKSGSIDLVINISEGSTRKDEVSAGYIMRRAAVDFDVSLITNVKCAIMLAECLERGKDKFKPRHIGEFTSFQPLGGPTSRRRSKWTRMIDGHGTLSVFWQVSDCI
jgi:carbamoyl-phosphate synthase/aspartate carbamoyltransferase